jgi:hypothetical protein
MAWGKFDYALIACEAGGLRRAPCSRISLSRGVASMNIPITLLLHHECCSKFSVGIVAAWSSFEDHPGQSPCASRELFSWTLRWALTQARIQSFCKSSTVSFPMLASFQRGGHWPICSPISELSAIIVIALVPQGLVHWVGWPDPRIFRIVATYDRIREMNC